MVNVCHVCFLELRVFTTWTQKTIPIVDLLIHIFAEWYQNQRVRLKLSYWSPEKDTRTDDG